MKNNSEMFFDGVTYKPKNEQELIALFMTFHRWLGFDKIERLTTRFPDCIAYKYGSKRRTRIEFEYMSSGFKYHLKPISDIQWNLEKGKYEEVITEVAEENIRNCDLVICWKDNFNDCPVPIFALEHLVSLNNFKKTNDELLMIIDELERENNLLKNKYGSDEKYEEMEKENQVRPIS